MSDGEMLSAQRSLSESKQRRVSHEVVDGKEELLARSLFHNKLAVSARAISLVVLIAGNSRQSDTAEIPKDL